MEKVNINPLKTLSFNELVQFKEAIDSNFKVTEIDGEIVYDMKTRWWDLHQECLKYAFDNHKEITAGYGNVVDYSSDEGITFGDIVIIMIKEKIGIY